MAQHQKQSDYFAQIADGLETMGANELSDLGATGLHPVRRGIHFKADRQTLYRVNYCTRLCTRILAPIRSFHCPDAKAIYRAAQKIDWSRYFRVDQTFAVFASTAGSRVPHSQFAGLTLKDAVVDQYRDAFGRRPSVDTRNPDLWINLYLQKDRGTISIDTSGGSLHRRGYRLKSVDAPMQETVAAAVVALSGWDGQTVITDPMCGSGTLIVEAVMSYCRIPAGYRRERFGFQQLPDFDDRLWKQVKAELDAKIRKLPPQLIYASDIDARAVAATRSNCKQIPHARLVNVMRMDLFQINALTNRIILCNPPYGIRMQGEGDMREFYRRLGDFLKQRCKGSTAYLYFGDREMIKSIGLKPAWKKPLRNGGLDGRLVKYELY
ncbi:RlmKL: ribosomal RNA large subunit methyltransferase fusion protein [Desulfosarcina variabilis str. Montpellier]|uniref:THUMP domain-containing class I SAM-dependent RNA methyltransferase n=1 Tax=Desulfosarcina variabilis TaxID=2300 RepID=UPI003AFAF73D